jgi:hypothetical protein
VVDRAYTDPELDAAIAALSHPQRLREAQDLVVRLAPALQRVLGVALEEGGWFDLGHDQAVREAAGREDAGQRVREVQTLLAEETRLGMLVGVAVGFELARELGTGSQQPGSGSQQPGSGSQQPGSGSQQPGSGSEHAQQPGSAPGAGTEQPTKQEDG